MLAPSTHESNVLYWSLQGKLVTVVLNIVKGQFINIIESVYSELPNVNEN